MLAKQPEPETPGPVAARPSAGAGALADRTYHPPVPLPAPSRAAAFDSRLLFLVAWAFGLSVIWFRPGPALLLGGDSGLYARIARELCERPLSQWWRLTVAGQPFFEHPPLGFWLEALVFRAAGASVDSAVLFARLGASLTLLLIGITGWEVATRRSRMVDGIDGPSMGAFAILGTLTLPGFLYESQIAMLEIPLMAALALGLWATASLEASRAPEGDRFPRGAVTAWALALVLGFWVKGPPILVLVGLVLALTVFQRIRPGVAAAAIFAGLLGLAVTTLGFDALREARGAEPFFRVWFNHQILPSIAVGRHHPDHSLTYFVGPSIDWYWPVVLALPVAVAVRFVRKKRPWAWRFSPELAALGALTWLGVFTGFSLMAQKYPWYLHLGAAGGGLLVGGLLALLPQRFERKLALALAAGALLWPAVRLVPWAPTLSQQQVLAVQTTPAPAGAIDQQVADCSSQEAWAAEHLMGFVWRARRVACDAPAPWKWNGVTLVRQP